MPKNQPVVDFGVPLAQVGDEVVYEGDRNLARGLVADRAISPLTGVSGLSSCLISGPCLPTPRPVAG